MPKALRLYPLGVVAYNDAWRWQQATAEAVRGGADEALAVLQHPPVFTFGRRVRPEHLLVDPATLARRGATVVESDRGGDVTFHGPGQIVAYSILDLRRRGLGVADYVGLLEEVMLRAAAGFGIEAQSWPGRPGVWAGGAKLGAIGVRVRGGVTTHGLALNVEPDLSWFDAIVPCGLSDVRVTSFEHLLGYSPGIAAVEAGLVTAFEPVFDCELSSEVGESAGAGVQNPAELVAHGR
jgi:lipoyl(octanoyl) transferase